MLPERRSAFDWHEGSGSTTTSVAGVGTNPLNAGNPATAWDGQAAGGQFNGYVFWSTPLGAEPLTEWALVFDLTFSVLSGEWSIAQVKAAYLNVGPTGAVKTYPGGTASAAGKWIAGQTQRVAWVNTAAGQRVTIDGVLVHTSANPVPINTTNDNVVIPLGKPSGGTILVDNLDVYVVALTDAEAVEATSPGGGGAAHEASGTVAATSATEGSATALLPASGTVEAVSATSGSMGLRAEAAGTVSATASTSGSMTAWLGATGTVAATSGASGTAGVLRPASGTVTATSSASGSMTARLPAAGTVDAVSGTSGSADTPGGMSGTVLAVSATSGAMTLRAAVSGTVAVVSVTTGEIAARLGAAGTVTTVSVVSGQAGVIRAGEAPSNTRVWDGSAWIPARPYVWNGSAWQPRTFQ